MLLRMKQSNPQNNDDTSVAQVEISVTGGTFEATSANGKAVESENVKNFINGGSFSSPVDKEHLVKASKQDCTAQVQIQMHHTATIQA